MLREQGGFRAIGTPQSGAVVSQFDGCAHERQPDTLQQPAHCTLTNELPMSSDQCMNYDDSVARKCGLV